MSEPHKPLEAHAVTLARPEVRAAEFEALYENSITPTAFVSPDGIFMSVNPAFAEMLGYSRLEMVGRKTWQEVTHREDIETDEEEANQLAQGKQVCYRIQKRYLHKDGRHVYCVVQVSRIPSVGSFIHFVKQAHEIPVASRNLMIERDENGNPMIVPTVRIEDFLKRNWKAISVVIVPIATWLGITINDYYSTKARAEFQSQQITSQQEELKSLKQRLDAHGMK